MGEIITLPDKGYIQKAVDKLAAELKAFKGDRYAMAVKDHVASILTHFCEEDAWFAEVVFKTKHTLSDCCSEIMKGCGNCVSDIDVYRGAVRNYFPNADIEFHMSFTITGDAPTEEEMNRRPKVETPKKKTAAKKPAREAPEKPSQKAPKKPTPHPVPKKPEKPKESGYFQFTLF